MTAAYDYDLGPEPEPGPLRRMLETEAREHGLTLDDLTVLAPQNDPFRSDTPARHRDGEWLAMARTELGSRGQHTRGLHYAVIGRLKPDGKPYVNTDGLYAWLLHAAKAARWLGYVPFDDIVDERNAEPLVRPFRRPDPWPGISTGLSVEIPSSVHGLMPSAYVSDFRGTQPYKLVIWGEKSSLEPVLGAVAAWCEADLYLTTGESSDTLLYQMARVAAEDGRPMVVLTFSDADPAGWQMPISVARKLQAAKAFQFHDLEFLVRRVGLTPEQVRAYGLPSTPLKATERRADRWREAMGVEQTEIDALAALRPALLREIAEEAITPFFDRTLAARVREAERAWRAEAQRRVDEQVGDRLDGLVRDAECVLNELREEVGRINDEARSAVREVILPRPVLPTARLSDEANGLPLLDSRWSFVEQCRRLIDSKAYRDGC